MTQLFTIITSCTNSRFQHSGISAILRVFMK